jgi:hypothetical protein
VIGPEALRLRMEMRRGHLKALVPVAGSVDILTFRLQSEKALLVGQTQPSCSEATPQRRPYAPSHFGSFQNNETLVIAAIAGIVAAVAAVAAAFFSLVEFEQPRLKR